VQNTKFIVNPAAGANSSRRKWVIILDLLKHLGFHFDYQYTEGSGHAIELAKEAAGVGYDRIVAVGGDGTVNEVANGILNSKNSAETALGIISTGTGGDFIRSAGIPKDYVRACSRLSSLERFPIDAGIIEYHQKGQKLNRFFLNTAGIGLDAAVVANVEKLPKYFGGTIPYLWGLVRTLLGYKNKYVTIKSGGNVTKQRVVSVIVANGGFAGGGMHFAPFAKLNDGLLDTVIVGDMGKFELLRSFPRVYKGTHVTLPKIKLDRTIDISVQSSERALVYADGEYLGEGPARFTLIPAAIRLVI
jgi:diacylglycerol kinase (ATP)